VSPLLDLAAALVVALGLAHSWLGERYLLRRLFRRDDLPRLFGSADFTRRTLRFAWHVTSVAWLGLAAVLVVLARPPISASALGLAVGVAFLVQGVIALAGSRGWHLSWPVFLAIDSWRSSPRGTPESPTRADVAPDLSTPPPLFTGPAGDPMIVPWEGPYVPGPAGASSPLPTATAKADVFPLRFELAAARL
jgi:hypothetical protein